MRNTLLWVGLAIVVTGMIVLVLGDILTGMDGARGDQIVSLVAMTALLVVLGGNMAGAYSGRGGAMLQHIAIWLAIIAAIALAYTYRTSLGFAA